MLKNVPALGANLWEPHRWYLNVFLGLKLRLCNSTVFFIIVPMIVCPFNDCLSIHKFLWWICMQPLVYIYVLYEDDQYCILNIQQLWYDIMSVARGKIPLLDVWQPSAFKDRLWKTIFIHLKMYIKFSNRKYFQRNIAELMKACKGSF